MTNQGGAQRLTTGINDARLSYIMVLAPRRTHYMRKECGAA